jgi:hypothetical protein
MSDRRSAALNISMLAAAGWGAQGHDASQSTNPNLKTPIVSYCQPLDIYFG